MTEPKDILKRLVKSTKKVIRPPPIEPSAKGEPKS